MDASPRVEGWTLKGKKGSAPTPSANSSSSSPTAFFLKTEKELEKGSTMRGRENLNGSTAPLGYTAEMSAGAGQMVDSSYGVQSLQDTIGSAFSSDSNLSRLASGQSETTSDAGLDETTAASTQSERKRRANRVHPSIIATGHRIISSERMPRQPSSAASPVPSEALFRDTRPRRNSGNSSVPRGQPLTPIKLSPHPQSATPSTPRSASPRSFRLSDEDSAAGETNSQAVMSSNEDYEDELERTPQLVMPSIALPPRRQFTERGRQIGRAKVMVLGHKRVGKSSLIHNICRFSEDIVHVDSAPISAPSHSSFPTDASECFTTCTFTEVSASTRPYPSWWTDVEGCRMLRPSRKSVGEGVLERNLTFIDTPGLEDDNTIQNVQDYFQSSLGRMARLESMGDSELLDLFSGNGGVQIDAVLYLFDPTPSQCSDPADLGFSVLHHELLRCLSRWTNLIPVVGKADTVDREMLDLRKQQIVEYFRRINVDTHSMTNVSAAGLDTPLAVSSALGDDGDTVDASVLMSSQYVPPLVPSELDVLVERLLHPSNISRMRHMSAIKFLRWRQENLGPHLDLRKQTLMQSPFPRSASPGATSTGSLLGDPSKILVPQSHSSFYRSASPALSDASGLEPSTSALARYHEQAQAQPSEPFRQVRLAKWAQDLQRGLAQERQKYCQMYAAYRPSEFSSDGGGDDEKSFDPRAAALVAANASRPTPRPARGRLGGDLGVIDPSDPLGVLALGASLRRRGFHTLQLLGGCGLLGAVAYWLIRHAAELQDFFAPSAPATMVTATAIPPPDTAASTAAAAITTAVSAARTSISAWSDDAAWRVFFGWEK